MARRSEDWNIDLAKRLRNRAFARAFLLAAIDEGLTVQQALAKIIRAIGIAEFAVQVGMPRPNVQRAIHPRRNPTQETLNRPGALPPATQSGLHRGFTPLAGCLSKTGPSTIRRFPGGFALWARKAIGSDRTGLVGRMWPLAMASQGLCRFSKHSASGAWQRRRNDRVPAQIRVLADEKGSGTFFTFQVILNQ